MRRKGRAAKPKPGASGLTISAPVRQSHITADTLQQYWGPAPGKHPTRIGVISDTHGLLRDEALQALRGSELIIHAGDIGGREILDSLSRVAPVVAVRGNTDHESWAAALPETAVAQVGPVLIYVLHDLHALDLDVGAAGFQVVVSGHSHQPSRAERDGVLYLNPGSAGPRRFRLPVTVARIELSDEPWKVEFVDLERLRGSLDNLMSSGRERIRVPPGILL